MSTPTQNPNKLEHARDEREQTTEEYVEHLRAFYAHAGVFVGVTTIVVMVNLFTNLSAGVAGEWSAWWSVWAFLGSGIGLAVHGFVVRLNRPVTSRD